MIHRKSLWLVCFINIILLSIAPYAFSQRWNPSHAIGTVSGKYQFGYNQTPDQLVEIYPAAIPATGLTYQWYISYTPNEGDFTIITGAPAQQSSYTPVPLVQTTYYRRRTTNSSGAFVYSNIVKLSVVSATWDDVNYLREHDVLITGVSSAWQTVDQLPIGQKLQTTTYLDGMGRPIEKVKREAATPLQVGGAWGDLVQVNEYDELGRQPKVYMPYSTTTETGRYKSSPFTEQPQYISNTYKETSGFNFIQFDNSPLNRIKQVNQSGASWASSTGNVMFYDMNAAPENVQIWVVDYVQGDAPVNRGAYPANTLFRTTLKDDKGSQIVEYKNRFGQLILRKVQLDDSPTAAHSGWLCTYYVYDDFGRIRFQIQPEGVKYLDGNNWSFGGTAGPTVLKEQCYQFNYDDKGRTIWKKNPGADPLNMLYDSRDRVVFMQDGNQASLPTPQWTANLYDELDRNIETVLYNTTKTVAALQSDINNAVTVTSYTFPDHTAATQSDPSYDSRDTRISKYVATNSISFVADAGGNFQSPDGDVFVAEIDRLPFYPGYSGSVTSLGNPISATDLNNASVTTVLKYLYYDNYSFSGAKSFDNNFTNTSAYSNSDPNVIPIAQSRRTLNCFTGSSIRVLGTNLFLSTTHYYDEKGRAIQTLEDNIKSGTDITTKQYHFDGRVLSSCESHSTPGTGYSGFIILDKYNFDKVGRVSSIQKQVGGNPFKTVASVEYDDIGRIKTKHLDPEYNNPNLGRADLESLVYSYNIHSQLTGINKDYALKTPATYDKWSHFFGIYLGYDNKDNVFVRVPQLNGQIAGALWSSQGDDAQRKYEYTYDRSGRLVNAGFNEQQHPGDGWSNSKMDFSVTGTSGQITYDLNGNLMTMLQKGVLPGMSAPITVDDLRYSYQQNSNRLLSISDQMTTPRANGLTGDFKDGNNGTSADYVYDTNGNVVVDLNKNAQSLNGGAPGSNGISYNYLDKPEQIRIVGKGTIKIVYAADGEKLQRVFIPENGGVASITTYINEFVYQETANLTLSSPAPFSGPDVHLSYINFEEGRIRVIAPTTTPGQGYDVLQINGNINLPNSMMGVWDYMVRDHQGNIRMVLTEETHIAGNTCTMESSRSGVEDPVFGQTGGGNEVEATRVPTPSGWQSANPTSSVSELGNLAGHNIGPNTLQKVMAGDQVTASVIYYYNGASTSSNPNIVPNLLNSLAAAMGGGATAGTLVHGNSAPITGQLGNTPGFVNAVEPSNSSGGTPQAYLTILFFDERFNFISAADGGVAQQQVASSWSAASMTLGLPSVKAPKNGYAFVYVSNRSDQSVFFDNLTVSINAGNIIEEDHYYAFGLKIAAISSRKLGDVAEGSLKNNYLYNGNELFDDADINWYDYGYRNYDAQTGRFVQIDPITDKIPFVSPYQYAFNDPATNTDAAGLIGIPCPGTSGIAIFLDKVGESLTNVMSAISPALQFVSLSINITNTAVHVGTVITNSNMINSQVTAIQAGGGPVIPRFPPIFWQEVLYPEVMKVDYEYAKSWEAIELGQVITLSEYPGLKFLVFHYQDLTMQHKINRRNSTRGVENPDPDLYDLHEVPYASTWESEYSRVLVRHIDYGENRGHGSMLSNFYENNNLQRGEMFLVPVMEDASKFPKWVPFPVKKTDEKKQRQLQPVPVLKYHPAPVATPAKKPEPPKLQPKPQTPTPPVWLIPVPEDVMAGLLELIEGLGILAL